MPNTPELELWDTKQAAAYLGVARQSVHELAQRGEVGRQVGRAWVFTQAELDAWLVKPRPKGGRPPKSDRRPLLIEAQPA